MNSFFVAAEYALVKVRGSRIEALAQEGDLRAKLAQRVTNNVDGYLLACQLGITLASLGLGWIGARMLSLWLHDPLSALEADWAVVHTISVAIAIIIIAALHIVLGELAPKTLAGRRAEATAMWTVVPLMLFYKLMYPFIWLLNSMANLILRRTGVKHAGDHESAHTEAEIRSLVKESHKSGLIDNTELALMDNIFEFSETHAHEIMIPRTDMVCLYAIDSIEAIKQKAFREMHTRFPVCESDKDHILGFVHIKDLVKTSPDIMDVRDIIRPIMSVPDSMSISALLKLMQKKKMQMAILIDEYGGTAGLVTLEDIIEEIVGEIQDEFDEDRLQIEKRDDRNYSIDGMLLIEELNAYFGTAIVTEDYDTIGGWIYARLDAAPKIGQRVRVSDDYEFVVEETDHLRIVRLQVQRLSHFRLDEVAVSSAML
ncbi:HlyC/CorC family transporter [Paenibacillus sp. 481]|nr:HlyC/CorC family transporter [Paenibacillus sp. 481]